jgi:hypothetical protein
VSLHHTHHEGHLFLIINQVAVRQAVEAFIIPREFDQADGRDTPTSVSRGNDTSKVNVLERSAGKSGFGYFWSKYIWGDSGLSLKSTLPSAVTATTLTALVIELDGRISSCCRLFISACLHDLFNKLVQLLPTLSDDLTWMNNIPTTTTPYCFPSFNAENTQNYLSKLTDLSMVSQLKTRVKSYMPNIFSKKEEIFNMILFNVGLDGRALSGDSLSASSSQLLSMLMDPIDQAVSLIFSLFVD